MKYHCPDCGKELKEHRYNYHCTKCKEYFSKKYIEKKHKK